MFNKTNPAELKSLSNQIQQVANYGPPDCRHRDYALEDLEARARMAVNPMMDGDAGPAFFYSHSAALTFIAWLYMRLALEMENRTSIGWAAFYVDGEPYRSIRSPDKWFERKEPVKIYKTKANAERHTPFGMIVKEVFV